MISKFGDNLKHIRTEKNISQQELADSIGSHATHVSRYERNLTVPSIDVVKKIAEALGISIDLLVFGKEQSIDNMVNDKELISLFKKVQTLPDKQKDTVKDFLSAFVLKVDLKEKLAS